MSTVSLDDPDAIQHLKDLLISDDEVLLRDGDVIVAKVSRVAEKAQPLKPRVPGAWAHLGIKMSDDFDDELPDSFWLSGEP